MPPEARPRVLCVDNGEDSRVRVLEARADRGRNKSNCIQASRGFKQNALISTYRRPVAPILMALDCELVRRLKQVEVTLLPMDSSCWRDGDDSKEKL